MCTVTAVGCVLPAGRYLLTCITFHSKKFMETVQDLSGFFFSLCSNHKKMIISKFFPSDGPVFQALVLPSSVANFP